MPRLKTALFVFGGLAGFMLFSYAGARALASSVSVNATVPSVCGNGVLDTGEQCDGSRLGGQTCATKGFSGGTLGCNANCTFNTSQCTSGASTAQTVQVGGGGSPALSSFVIITVTSSAANVGASSTIILSATVTDPAQVSSLWFTLDGRQIGNTLSSQPYLFQFNVASTSPGDHILTAMATNHFGNLAASQPITVTIGGAPPLPAAGSIATFQAALDAIQRRLLDLFAAAPPSAPPSPGITVAPPVIPPVIPVAPPVPRSTTTPSLTPGAPAASTASQTQSTEQTQPRPATPWFIAAWMVIGIFLLLALLGMLFL